MQLHSVPVVVYFMVADGQVARGRQLFCPRDKISKNVFILAKKSLHEKRITVKGFFCRPLALTKHRPLSTVT